MLKWQEIFGVINSINILIYFNIGQIRPNHSPIYCDNLTALAMVFLIS